MGTGLGQDGYGNTISFITTEGQNMSIILTLKKDGKCRNIGHIKDGIYCKKETKDGIFRVLNSFGFCRDMLVHLAPKGIQIEYNGEKYFVSMERFDRHKKFLNYSGKGYEVRAYLPLCYFKRST